MMTTNKPKSNAEQRAQSTPKPFGGYIKHWCRHDLAGRVPEGELATLREKHPGVRPEIITGEVVEDKLGRWLPGNTMCSTPLMAFDEKRFRVETLNTVYQLVGPGRFSKRFHGVIEEEVGMTLLLLAKDKGLQIDIEGGDILVYPNDGTKSNKE